jgi:hypothetical protein
MRERLRRSVLVDASLPTAWDYLSRPGEWPQTWAKHLKRVDCDPPGAVTATTRGIVEMRDGFKSRMTMAEFRPGRNWKWVGESRIGPSTAFNHEFEAVDEHRTRLNFLVATEGFLEPLFGRLAAIYLGRKLDRNLPQLVHALNDIGKSEKQT